MGEIPQQFSIRRLDRPTPLQSMDRLKVDKIGRNWMAVRDSNILWHVLSPNERSMSFRMDSFKGTVEDQAKVLADSVGCTLVEPCYSYTEVPEYLASIALANLTGQIKGKVKAEVQKKTKEVAKKLIDKARKSAPEDLKKQIDKLKLKL